MSENIPLVGTGKMGDFVHANQTMAAQQDFGKVSKLWFDKTSSYEDGLAAIENQVAEREDITGELKEAVIGVDNGGRIAVSVDGRSFLPTVHAIMQLATWLDIPHTMVNWFTKPRVNQNGTVKIARDLQDTEYLVRGLRMGQRHVEAGKKFLFRAYKDGTLRAVLSDIYGIIDNRWYIETLKALIPGGRMSHWRGDADTIYGNVLIPDTIREDKDSDYGGMISLGNCEIGIRRLEQYPSVFRAICMNGCIWDQTKGNIITQVHRGEIDLVDLRERIMLNVNKQIPLLQSGVDRFLAMRDRPIDAECPLSNLFAAIAKDNGFSNAQVNEVAEQFLQNEKTDRNAFGVVNAITRAGQKFSNANWLDFDMVAGNLMNMSDTQWGGLVSRAKSLDEKVVAKMFAVAA
jgi:hypothetical protein